MGKTHQAKCPALFFMSISFYYTSA